MRILDEKLGFAAMICLIVIVIGCDSIDKAAKKIMADQGLTLLQPARDYIALGGIVSLPNGSRPIYEDPYDLLPNDNGTYSSFNAIVSQNTKNQSIGIDAAIGSLGSYVALPVSISGLVNHSSSVKLSQIDTGGTRYTTQKVAALLTRQATSDAIKADLQAGRVFVIQEVYTATSFSITSANATSVAAAAGGSAPSPQCSTSSGTPGSGNSGAAGSGGNSGAAAGNSGAAGSGGNSGTAAGNSGAGSAPMSLGFCWGGNSSLSFTTDRPIPFAVRLNEVQLGPGGVLQIKKTNFKLPLNTLGADNASNTATVPSGLLTDLERKSRN